MYIHIHIRSYLLNYRFVMDLVSQLTVRLLELPHNYIMRTEINLRQSSISPFVESQELFFLSFYPLDKVPHLSHQFMINISYSNIKYYKMSEFSFLT